MNTEPQVVESAPSTENIGAEAVETPEVAKPEPTEGADPPKAQEKTPEQKEAEQRQRRITKLERTNARLYAEHEQAMRELEKYRSKAAPTEDREKVEVDPDEIQQTIQTRAQQIARAERLNERCNQIVSKGEEQFPDFMTSVKTLGMELPLFQRDGAPTAALEVILEADNPPALLHHLGKNPDLVDQLTDLSPIQLARRLDRIERDMNSKPAEQKSSAARPLEPVKPAAAPTAPDPSKTKEWIEWRNKTAKR